MSWIVVDLTESEQKIMGTGQTVYRYECRQWLRDESGVNGVLWKNDWCKSIYYFANPHDATLFKLKFQR